MRDGSGIAEYMFFVDNKAGSGDTVVRNETGQVAEPHKATFTANMGRYLGQVAVVDKAGNISAVQVDTDARTKMYKYSSSSGSSGRPFYPRIARCFLLYVEWCVMRFLQYWSY